MSREAMYGLILLGVVVLSLVGGIALVNWVSSRVARPINRNSSAKGELE